MYDFPGLLLISVVCVCVCVGWVCFVFNFVFWWEKSWEGRTCYGREERERETMNEA